MKTIEERVIESSIAAHDANVRPVGLKVRPSNRFQLHCPFCDEKTGKFNDSMIGRKKLGLHIADEHSEEVRFKRGTAPPPLIYVED